MKRILALGAMVAALAGGAQAQTLYPGTTTDASTTITAGGTYQSAFGSNTNRHGCFIQNPTTATEVLYVYFGPTASASNSHAVTLTAGAWVNCQGTGNTVLTDNIAVNAATTGHAFVAYSQ